jgi:GTPase SAR1 family protein
MTGNSIWNTTKIQSNKLRMTDTVTSQNIELSSWDTPYIPEIKFCQREIAEKYTTKIVIMHMQT